MSKMEYALITKLKVSRNSKDSLHIFKVLITLSLCLSACSKKDKALEASREYCDCMKKNNSPANYSRATKICESDLICKYPLLKVFYVDMQEKDYGQINKTLADSARKFAFRFISNVNHSCCFEVGFCDSLKTGYYYKQSVIGSKPLESRLSGSFRNITQYDLARNNTMSLKAH